MDEGKAPAVAGQADSVQPDAAVEHLLWACAQGQTPRTVLESLGYRPAHDVDWNTVYAALTVRHRLILDQLAARRPDDRQLVLLPGGRA